MTDTLFPLPESLDRFPFADLPDRYQISKGAIYERLKKLGIKTFKEGRFSYITAEEVKLMDEQHEKLKLEGKLIGGGELVRSPDEITLDTSPVIEISIDNLRSLIVAHSHRVSPLQGLRELEEAAEKGWILSGKEIKSLIGSSPKVGDWGSFRFSKQGRRGRNIGWRVEKLNPSGFGDRSPS